MEGDQGGNTKKIFIQAYNEGKFKMAELCRHLIFAGQLVYWVKRHKLKR